MKAGIDALILSRKKQVKPHSFSWFLPACALAISNRKNSRLYQTDTLDYDISVSLRNECKHVLTVAKLLFTDNM